MIWGFGRAAFQNTNIFIRFYYSPKVLYTGHIATLGSDYTSFGDTAESNVLRMHYFWPRACGSGPGIPPKVQSPPPSLSL